MDSTELVELLFRQQQDPDLRRAFQEKNLLSFVEFREEAFFHN